MNKVLKINTILICIFTFCFQNYGFVNTEYELAEYSLRYDPDRDPVSDLVNAIQSAEENNRLVLIIVGGDWCSWCHTLDNYINSNKEFKRSFYNTFEVVKVFYGSDNDNGAFLAQFPKIKAYPHFFVVNIDFQILASQNTGVLEKQSAFPFLQEQYNNTDMHEFLDKWQKHLQAYLKRRLRPEAETAPFVLDN